MRVDAAAGAGVGRPRSDGWMGGGWGGGRQGVPRGPHTTHHEVGLHHRQVQRLRGHVRRGVQQRQPPARRGGVEGGVRSRVRRALKGTCTRGARVTTRDMTCVSTTTASPGIVRTATRICAGMCPPTWRKPRSRVLTLDAAGILPPRQPIVPLRVAWVRHGAPTALSHRVSDPSPLSPTPTQPNPSLAV
jgi:hypothetical protein